MTDHDVPADLSSLHRHGVQFRALLFMGHMGKWLLYFGVLGHRGADVYAGRKLALLMAMAA